MSAQNTRGGMGGGTGGGGIGETSRDSGLVGGIFNKKEHDGIHVKFSDVDWATIVRAGGFISHGEVRV